MIRIGTAGFSYDDWRGPFYPPKLPKTKWFDFYAEHFDCLEINSSYYSWLGTKTTDSLVSRAPRNFLFTLKLHGSITHERDDLDHGITATLDQNRVFAESEMLGAHLAQFPNSFHRSEANKDYIRRLADGVDKLCIEFRHASWAHSDELLREIGAGWVCVDEPHLRGLLGWLPAVTSDIAYFRFHGRNAAKWYAHAQAFERYDYLYSEEELEGRAPDILAAGERAGTTFAVFNNHYGAQAVTNARQLSLVMGIPEPGWPLS
jgi:uncharacterized protein YecE (DUF72 family)